MPVYESTQPVVDFEMEATDDVSGVQSGVGWSFSRPPARAFKEGHLEEEAMTTGFSRSH